MKNGTAICSQAAKKNASYSQNFPVRMQAVNTAATRMDLKKQLKKHKKLERELDALLKGRENLSLVQMIRKWILPAALGIILYYLIIPPFIYPVHGITTSPYFFRTAPDQVLFPSLEFHPGIDIAADTGVIVRASKSGFVSTAGWSDVLGNYAVIEHWLGFSTVYGHMSELHVASGSFIIKGFSVGSVGSTGRSTGSHLHFEVRWFGTPVPPDIFCIFDGLRRSILSSFF
ncbi:MAG: M23 family metallopeptidase [Spirochaetia bacterium]